MYFPGQEQNWTIADLTPYEQPFGPASPINLQGDEGWQVVPTGAYGTTPLPGVGTAPADNSDLTDPNYRPWWQKVIDPTGFGATFTDYWGSFFSGAPAPGRPEGTSAVNDLVGGNPADNLNPNTSIFDKLGATIGLPKGTGMILAIVGVGLVALIIYQKTR